MTDSTKDDATVVRTHRGLTIAGTRITIYAILDYLRADWSPKLIQDWLGLTDVQMAGVLAYIEAHRDEIEQEYQQIVQQAEESRRYWDERNRDRSARRLDDREAPERNGIRAKLQAWKDKISQE